MKTFEHVEPKATRDALGQLAGDGLTFPIAGGTDLLTVMKKEIVRAQRLVNLKEIAELRYIREDSRGGLRLGALATLDEVERHPLVRERYPALAQAIAVSASPQLRTMGTIGGNLCQHSRCWYYREDFHCWLKGGEVCYARDGQNAQHAIFGGGPCYSTQPSDPGPALVALGARVRILGPSADRERTIPIEELFVVPTEDRRRLTALAPDELIVEVQVSRPAPGQRSRYLKAMDRAIWAFALVSVAANLRLDGGRIAEARLVLGGVAPKPWRAHDAEAALAGRPLDTAAIADATRAAVRGAQPLVHNAYKVPLAEGLVKRILEDLVE
ncbi:MAG: xanthine dehydrogenase family protein subunit M [Chloroflexi bacterium]|nr:xanthine dehydrogenase family protein subunit M [Chloroflexota bacterium]